MLERLPPDAVRNFLLHTISPPKSCGVNFGHLAQMHPPQLFITSFLTFEQLLQIPLKGSSKFGFGIIFQESHDMPLFHSALYVKPWFMTWYSFFFFFFFQLLVF
jgi:hypothetical protein